METIKPDGICPKEIKFEVEDGVVKEVEFSGGCSGSLAGIANLIKGQPVDEVADKLAGITCRNGTSCPDQLSKALRKVTDN
ncbi:TIGR03905 family TSCPD domain-containing protein [Natroniella sulfidigena]|uniref:TIGR03905 family TSCPD domain-containing protein n=1 Tax=Natroniella sulfidigena TaxID=723921 RepID=UPI00200A9E5E|nr:TIGR03905 family TSCPD domain-containing protein [Natroniella sulfidigena]MCK8818199.1 TIGR03905 family TSCPD domain-containing protein [Natroniella sulfidigena]